MRKQLSIDEMIIKWNNKITSNQIISEKNKTDISNRISIHFNNLNLKKPEIVYCSSPMEAYAFVSVFNTAKKVDFSINEAINRYCYEREKRIVQLASGIIEPDTNSIELLNNFKNLIDKEIPIHINRTFDSSRNQNEDYPNDNYTPFELSYFKYMENTFTQLFDVLLPEVRLTPDEWIPYQVMSLKSFGFSLLMNSIYLSSAAYIDYTLFRSDDKSIGDIDRSQLNDFMIDHQFNICNTLIFTDTSSDVNYCLISLKPKEAHFSKKTEDSGNHNSTLNRMILHNTNDYAVKFEDGWGFYFIHDTYFSKIQFDNYILGAIDEDLLNMLDFIGYEIRIVDALRSHYGYSAPEQYEFWKWLHPGNEEWPMGSTEEHSRLAIEREKNETLEERTKRIERENAYLC